MRKTLLAIIACLFTLQVQVSTADANRYVTKAKPNRIGRVWKALSARTPTKRLERKVEKLGEQVRREAPRRNKLNELDRAGKLSKTLAQTLYRLNTTEAIYRSEKSSLRFARYENSLFGKLDRYVFSPFLFGFLGLTPGGP